MLVAAIYHKFWGITFVYVFLQLKCQSSLYDIYNEGAKYMRDFHARSNNTSEVLGNNFCICVFAS